MVLFWTLVTLSALAAAVDWRAVAIDDQRLEYAAKPAVLAALIAAAARLPLARTDLVDRRWWFVAALACCLVGDVLLMLPRDRFVPGLASFLAGHVLFVVGFLHPPAPSSGFELSATGLAVTAVVVAAIEVVPGVAIFRALLRSGHRELLAPVAVYVAAIATMVVLAVNVGSTWAAVGAVLFLASDTLLALDRFVRPVPRGKLAVHVTYHLAQMALVLSLVR